MWTISCCYSVKGLTLLLIYFYFNASTTKQQCSLILTINLVFLIEILKYRYQLQGFQVRNANLCSHADAPLF